MKAPFIILSADPIREYALGQVDDLPDGLVFGKPNLGNLPRSYCFVETKTWIAGIRFQRAISVPSAGSLPEVFYRASNNGIWSGWGKVSIS